MLVVYDYLYQCYIKIAVLLCQLEASHDGVACENPLLSISINGLSLEMNDRNWDLQGGVSLHDIAILDHITKGQGSGNCHRNIVYARPCKWGAILLVEDQFVS